MLAFNHLGKLGQLGNQMFQYAATVGIANKLGIDYMIPNHKQIFIDSLNNKLRIELFDCFDITPSNVGELKTGRYVSESGFAFDKFLFQMNTEPSASLMGFFQTEKYFKHVEDQIRKQFTFKKNIIKDCNEIINESFNNPIALHIRRGDFLINSGNHNNLTLDYYKEALSKFDNQRQVIIFSDDSSWCMECELFRDDRFIVSTGNSSYHDLYMMTQCKDFIIANSTFSWWGAWLADTGKVIAPKKWFGPDNAHLDTKDLYPEHWEVI